MPCLATSIESPSTTESGTIPQEYQALYEPPGYIRLSTSLAAAGFFFIEKKDGGLRPCIDYRGLNAITVHYPYPLPSVPATLEQLRETWIFTELYLRSAYNLVQIREGDEWKTAFHMTKGHYKYLVMPFGLTNAPAVFQAFINEIFKDLIGRYIIAYIDEILIYSASYCDHVHHLNTVLTRLLHHQLFVKAEKCELLKDSIAFLGYVISQRGVEMDSRKVRTVTDWPEPVTAILGVMNFYCQFIRNYSSIANLLTSLLQGKPRQHQWTEQTRAAFVQLKKSFTTAPILRHPDPMKGLPTAMETAILLFNQVFRSYGLPEDIVSDHGLQCTSRVWRVCSRGQLSPQMCPSCMTGPTAAGRSGRALISGCRGPYNGNASKQTNSRDNQLWISNLKLKLPCCKLRPHFIGHFRIVCQVNPVTYHLSLPPSYHISPTFHVSLLMASTPLPGRCPAEE
ncbi:hypothetical protein QTP86_022234 [Hemibagrus guttatus]|nr:hypothetical protein QTP86_022234 [Hemibagrus guttatus]